MELIDKAALVAEIERIRTHEFYLHLKEDESAHRALDMVLGSLDTLEVKEVDLDFQRFAKEMDAIFALPSSETKNTEEEPLNWEYAVAKHFFELGMQASNKIQKGE